MRLDAVPRLKVRAVHVLPVSSSLPGAGDICTRLASAPGFTVVDSVEERSAVAVVHIKKELPVTPPRKGIGKWFSRRRSEDPPVVYEIVCVQPKFWNWEKDTSLEGIEFQSAAAVVVLDIQGGSAGHALEHAIRRSMVCPIARFPMDESAPSRVAELIQSVDEPDAR